MHIKILTLGIILSFVLLCMPSMFGYNLENKNNIIFEESSGPMDSPWPMYGHDVRHTGRSPYSTADNPLTEKWRFYTREHGYILGGPVIDSNGIIYFGANDRYLYALNPDGTLKWLYKTDGGIKSTPALDVDGTIYIGSWDDHLYAINPDGTLKWRISIGSSVSSSPAIGLDGVIYIGNEGIYAINPDGSEKWHYPTGNDVRSSPAIGNDGTIYAGSSDGYFYALNPDGTLLWQFDTQGWLRGSPTIADDGTVYVEGHGELFAFYPNNGTVKWILEIGATFLSPSLDNNGVIYIGTSEYMFYAINPDGTIRWTFDPGNRSALWRSSAAISADGTIYFGTHVDYDNRHGGDIIALNSDGTEKWRKRIAEDLVDSSPCIGEDGTVYIGSATDRQSRPDDWDFIGYLHAFGPVTSNEPPETPELWGTLNGGVRKALPFWISTIEPDLNPISYYFDWGDGTNSGWISQYGSGEEVYVEHVYSETGDYTIKAKAKDDFGGESDWVTLEISVPKSKSASLLYWFLEEHPIFRTILERVLS